MFIIEPALQEQDMPAKFRDLDIWAKRPSYINPFRFSTAKQEDKLNRPYFFLQPGTPAYPEREPTSLEADRKHWAETHGYEVFSKIHLLGTEVERIYRPIIDMLGLKKNEVYRRWVDNMGALIRKADKYPVLYVQPYPNTRPLMEFADALEADGYEIIHADWDGWEQPTVCPLIIICKIGGKK